MDFIPTQIARADAFELNTVYTYICIHLCNTHTHTHTCTPTYVHTTHAFNLFACNPGRSIGRHECIGITYACNCQHRLHHPGLCCFFMRPVVYIYMWVGGWVGG